MSTNKDKEKDKDTKVKSNTPEGDKGGQSSGAESDKASTPSSDGQGPGALVADDEGLLAVKQALAALKSEAQTLLAGLTIEVGDLRATVLQLKGELDGYRNEAEQLNNNLKVETEKLIDAAKPLLKMVETSAERKNGDDKSLTISTGVIKTTSSAGSDPQVHANTGLTKVAIQYPVNYTGAKHFKDGDVKFVSKESADIFVAKGFGKIVE